MRRSIVIALATLMAPVLAVAQPARADSVAALAAVEQFHAALAAGDSVRAISLLSDDVLILESGATQTRAQYLGGHLGADMRASQGSKGERTVTKVTVIGDVAYVVSRTIAPSNPPPNAPPPAAGASGDFVSESAELMIVSKTPDGWKIRAVHWSSRRRRT